MKKSFLSVFFILGLMVSLPVFAQANISSMVFVSISDAGFTGQMSKYETTNDQYCEYLNAAYPSEIKVVSGVVYASDDASNSEPYFSTYPDGSDYSQIEFSEGNFSVRTRDSKYMGNHPVVEVSWYGATAFCEYYNYRLPTEWEWQAVADYDGSFTYGCGTTINHSKANYDQYNPLSLSSYPYTTSVGYYSSYGYGMCDMAGNVWEWTSSSGGLGRILRGGGWYHGDNDCTVLRRNDLPPEGASDRHGLGFRVVLSIAYPPPLPQEQPDYPEPNLPDEPNKLVFITHGWNTDQNGFNDVWIPFGNAIQAKIDGANDANEWDVWVYSWTIHSGAGQGLANTPRYALKNAVQHGMARGKWIASQNYDHVHFIGHSAGAALIAFASEQVRNNSSARIHCTFLDAYTGVTLRNAKQRYGNFSDFSENYFSYDIAATHPILPLAHNVDITPLNPAYPYPTFPDRIEAHKWPMVFYHQTVNDTNGTIEGANYNEINYGFCRSLEKNGWEQSQTLEVGNYPPVVLGLYSSEKHIESRVREDSFIDLSSKSQVNSSTGTVDVNGTQVTMGTDSPVWTIIIMDVNKPVNVVTFDANFTSDVNAEGLLAVYWNEQHLGNIDERYVLDGTQEYSFELPAIYQPGTYVFKIRIDPFSSTPTTVVIDNISTGVGTSGYDYKIDGKIDFLDFAKFSSYWMHTDCNDDNDWCDRADLDESGLVDPNDLNIFTQHWLEGAQ